MAAAWPPESQPSRGFHSRASCSSRAERVSFCFSICYLHRFPFLPLAHLPALWRTSQACAQKGCACGGLMALTRVPWSPLRVTDGAGQMRREDHTSAITSVLTFLKALFLRHLLAFCVKTRKASISPNTVCGTLINKASWNPVFSLSCVGSTCSDSCNVNVGKHGGEALSSVTAPVRS